MFCFIINFKFINLTLTVEHFHPLIFNTTYITVIFLILFTQLLPIVVDYNNKISTYKV